MTPTVAATSAGAYVRGPRVPEDNVFITRLRTSVATLAVLGLATVCLCACGSTLVTSRSTTTHAAAAPKTPTSTVTGPSTPTSTVTSPSTPSPKPKGPSLWDRPKLAHPQTITITASNFNLKLPQTQDFILRCPTHRVMLPS